MTIFGRVLCPLQPSCLPPPHAARALMLSSFPFLVVSCFSRLLLLLHTRTEHSHLPLSISFFLSLLLITSFLSPFVPLILLLPFLPKPSAQPPSPLFTASFVLSLLPLFPISPLSCPCRKLCTSRLTPLVVYRQPGLLDPGLFCLHPCLPNHPFFVMHTCS